MVSGGWDFVFFFKQKTAYEMRMSDWSSDVCSSDLATSGCSRSHAQMRPAFSPARLMRSSNVSRLRKSIQALCGSRMVPMVLRIIRTRSIRRSEEHTSELQSLMRISYAVFCLKKKKTEQHKMPMTHIHKRCHNRFKHQ